MSEGRTLNALIKSTYLGGWDNSVPGTTRGMLTAYVHVEMAGSGIGLGGYSLQGEATDWWIRGVLDAVRVPSWEKLPGTHCRIIIPKGMGPAVSIGHIIEERWFHYSDQAKRRFDC